MKQGMEREDQLYLPIKAMLEAQGYEVKGEVGAVDVMARRGDEEPVIVELKLRFSLSLFHQAIARQSVTDLVYIAVPRPKGRQARRMLKDNLALSRRLGLGLITVLEDGRTEVHCDPGPYAPRKSKKRQQRLLREFGRLQGDPNLGGSTRRVLMTVYRQDALACAGFLVEAGPSKGASVAKATGVKRATQVMRSNHYGWFEKVSVGVYQISDKGRLESAKWPSQPEMPKPQGAE